MNQFEYAQYLNRLTGDEFDIDDTDDIMDISDSFYGYFQCFMPDGKDAERIFTPLEHGELYWERIKPIYDIGKQHALDAIEQGMVAGYFIPSRQSHEAEILKAGERWLQSLKTFADFTDNELIAGLNTINTVVIKRDNPDNYTADYPINEILSELLSE